MNAPTLRVRLVQMDVKPGRPEENTARMLREIQTARDERADLVVFPEMAVPGYLLGDEWEYETFLRDCERCAWDLAAASRGVTVVFGSVGLDWKRKNEDGRVRKYNAVFVARDRSFYGPAGSPYEFVAKTLLPNYRLFDESRHFFDLRKLALELGRSVDDLVGPVDVGGCRLGCTVCEDAWDDDYTTAPLDTLARKGADVFINISASPYTFNKNAKRRRVFLQRSRQLGRPLVFVNHVGVQNNGKTVFAFDGGSCVYDGWGHATPCGTAFEDTAVTLDIPRGGGTPFGETADCAPDDIGSICRAILYGTRRFMEWCGVERVVIGVSGGVDSAVAAALYRRLLPADRLLLMNMPGPYTSETTRGLARSLSRALGCYYAEVPIGEAVDLTRRQIHDLPIASADGRLQGRLCLTDFMMENVQARDRSARLLAAAAAAFGGVFTCNANKSELTVGYSTFYGDLGGYFANLADLWKTEVYQLARYLNERVYGQETIPQGIFEVTPSAELSPAQNVDEKKGDPLIYAYHDCLFRAWVERWNRAAAEDVLSWYAAGTLEREIGYEGHVRNLFPSAAEFVADLERWWDLYQGLGVAKRIQAPPVLALKRRAFGFDVRESQIGARYTRRYRELKARLLAGSPPAGPGSRSP